VKFSMKNRKGGKCATREQATHGIPSHLGATCRKKKPEVTDGSLFLVIRREYVNVKGTWTPQNAPNSLNKAEHGKLRSSKYALMLLRSEKRAGFAEKPVGNQTPDWSLRGSAKMTRKNQHKTSRVHWDLDAREDSIQARGRAV